MTQQWVTISIENYESLLSDSRFLEALMRNGLQDTKVYDNALYDNSEVE